MGLNARGVLSLIAALAYIPVLIVAIILVFRHGFKKETGYIFLLIFSAIRVIGGCLYVAAELITPIDASLFKDALILQSIGVSPLMMATLGFLGLAIANTSLGSPRMVSGIRLLHLLASLCVILSIVGGSSSSSKSSSTNGSDTGSVPIQTNNTEGHIGTFLYLLLLGLITALVVYFLSQREGLDQHRVKILKGIRLTIPLILVRVVYSILSSFSSPTNALEAFNLIEGSWATYLFLAILPEYAAVLIYCIVGVSVPRNHLVSGISARPDQESAGGTTSSSNGLSAQPSGNYPMTAAYAPNPNTYNGATGGGMGGVMSALGKATAGGGGRRGRRGGGGLIQGIIAGLADPSPAPQQAIYHAAYAPVLNGQQGSYDPSREQVPVYGYPPPSGAPPSQAYMAPRKYT